MTVARGGERSARGTRDHGTFALPRSRAAAFLFHLALVGTWAASSGSASPLRAQESSEIWREVRVADGVIAFMTSERVDPSNRANVVVFHGSDATLVVDTQDHPRAARWVIESLARHDLPPVRWVVNTHAHSDHTLGNSAWVELHPEAVLVSHPVTRDSIEAAGDRYVAEQRERLSARAGRIAEAIGAGRVPEEERDAYRTAAEAARRAARELEGVHIATPTLTVSDSRLLDLGGRTVQLLHPGPAHTGGDLVVWDPETGVLAAGDLIEEAPLWIEGADIEGWSVALMRLVDLGPDRVIPSHGRLRPDAALLDAHARLLDRAVLVSKLYGAGSESSILAEFDDIRGVLAPWGVENDALGRWIVKAVRQLGGPRHTALPSSGLPR